MRHAGDSYRFTLQPVFADMDHSYRCHLRRRVPDLLYQLWFYVSVPGGDSSSSFETPRQHVEVRPMSSKAPTSGGRPNKDQQLPATAIVPSLVSGLTTVEFLHVEYDAAIDLPDDVVLAGRKSVDAGKWSHVIEGQQRRSTAYGSGIANVSKLSENVYVAAVNFEQPFGYSTSTWVQGQSSSVVNPFRALELTVNRVVASIIIGHAISSEYLSALH
jgi:hypothetical protein